MANIAMHLKVTTPRDRVGNQIRQVMESWIELFRRMYMNTIGRVATQLAEQMKFENRTYAPVASDFVKLNLHIKEKIVEAEKKLDIKFSTNAWQDLNKYCMLQLLMFNRKRKAEVELMTIEAYNRKKGEAGY